LLIFITHSPYSPAKRIKKYKLAGLLLRSWLAKKRVHAQAPIPAGCLRKFFLQRLLDIISGLTLRELVGAHSV
jgi:hypothetical protein